MKTASASRRQVSAAIALALGAAAQPAFAAAPQWEYVVVATAPPNVVLSDPALDRDPATGALQLAYAQQTVMPFPGYDDRDAGVYLVTIGGVTKVVARSGDPVPSSDLLFSFIFGDGLRPTPVVSLSQGQVAFKGQGGQVRDGTAPLNGIYVGDGVGALRRVVDTTTAMPDAAGVNFADFGAPLLSYGRLVFSGRGGPAAGVYGDFGAGLIVVADVATPPGALYVDRFTDFGTYPSVSPTYFGHDLVAFLAGGTFDGGVVTGEYGRQIDGGTPGGWGGTADTYNKFPHNQTSFRSPSIDFSGAIAFRADVAGAQSAMSGLYAGRLVVNPVVTGATPVPGTDGVFFSNLGVYPSIDAAPRQVGQETTQHWLGFTSEQGVFMADWSFDFGPMGLETVIDLPGIIKLLAPKVADAEGATVEIASIDLFHQAVKDGAVAFRVSVRVSSDGGATFGGIEDFIILARKTTPTLTLLPDADTYVRADLGIRRNDNYGLQDFVEVGSGRADVGQAEGAPDKMRALLHFDTSMLPPLKLTSAVLGATLLSYDNGLPGSVYTVDAHAILAPWVAPNGEGNGYEGPRPPGAAALLTDPDGAYGVAWAGRDMNDDPYAANNSSQPAFDPAVLSTQLIRQQSNVAGDAFGWDLTALAQSWLSKTAPRPNYGIALADATGDVFRGVRLGSREGEHYALPGAVPGPRLDLKWSVGVLPGDLSGDNCVDRDDLAILMAVVRGQAIAGAGLAPVLDLNGDGKVDIADARKLATLFSHPLGAPCP